ncbi:hypothetical protein [Pseudoxanthomonas sp. CF125]|uniref:hypothetical protein n=1 Tax=Pseudoxanthomonas sp. CF125 TaxID=1855303 RepID=UPI00115FB9AA|nr:hypothetical protein [Pseudoxanthomonas sp. CF125]
MKNAGALFRLDATSDSFVDAANQADSGDRFAFFTTMPPGCLFKPLARRPDPALQWVLSAPAGRFQYPNRPFRRAIPRPVAAAAKTGKVPTILAGTPHGPGAAMSITDFLFSLHKLLAWLFALLTVLLPQHLLGPLPATDTPAAVPAAATTTQLCVQTPAPPRKLARAVLPPSNTDEAGTAANASDGSEPRSAPRTKQ